MSEVARPRGPLVAQFCRARTGRAGPLCPVFQTSICSAVERASSTSMPRYLTVLSILVWPSKSYTARTLGVEVLER